MKVDSLKLRERKRGKERENVGEIKKSGKDREMQRTENAEG